MASRLGPLTIECDAPPYAVVSASREVGMESPEDVRWVRMSHFHSRWESLTSLFGSASWAALLGGKGMREVNCSCGHALPGLETCSFLFSSGKTRQYVLGQCDRCHTVFWDEA